MAKVLPLVYYPDPVLQTPSSEILVFDASLDELIEDMFETMYAERGIGLAAPQIGVGKRLAVIDIEGDKKKQIVLINPEIIERSGKGGIEEGCLSVPGSYGFVERDEVIKVSALDAQGKAFSFSADGLLAICVQHEVDHLNGKLFCDHLSPLKRNRIKSKMEKFKRHLGK